MGRYNMRNIDPDYGFVRTLIANSTITTSNTVTYLQYDAGIYNLNFSIILLNTLTDNTTNVIDPYDRSYILYNIGLIHTSNREHTNALLFSGTRTKPVFTTSF
ncbi:hypothetical protein EUGRSUZ_J00123 [Eucalyptus grandis]|uniref:Uncharacterized protein n=2 Tax=Eucalyptus grandis TaxID=71139 RepID=A0A059A9E9_EUCGR|nr:hypothetical protein EUGRSUZ_J00123 [Eucalyptus grandis]